MKEKSKVLETERLFLRAITIEDAEEMYAYFREPNVGPNAGWKPHECMEETNDALHTIFIGKEGTYGIVLKENGKIVGSLGLIEDPKRENSHTRMLGYSISESEWGKGFMTEAVKRVIQYGFEEMGLELISAYCYPHNERSKSVIRKCEFTYEGTLRRCEVLYNGAIYDNECYSLLKQEK